MLCITLRSLTRVCSGVSGGIARIWIFDGEDFDWTQGPAVDGALPEYTAVELVAGATALTGAKMFPIVFADKTAKYSYTQSRKGCSVKYEHQFEFALPDLGHLITNWNEVVDAAGCCCGLGIVAQLNTGKIIVAGEKVVNSTGVAIPLKMVQDGSTGDTGLLLDDENQQNTIIKGEYGRGLYEFTGGVGAIIGLE